MNFARGISNLKLLTAQEWAGVAFAISLIIRSDEGFHLFNTVYLRHLRKQEKLKETVTEDENVSCEGNELEDSDNKNDVLDDNNSAGGVEGDSVERKSDFPFRPMDVLYILEMMLSFHAWYKCGGPYNCGTDDGRNEIQKCISTMLSSILKEIPRSEKNGWKIQKFHDMLHVSHDMYQFGNPQNWDASPGEHNLIYFAKRPARRTQKRNATFTMQVTQRLQETAVLSKVSNLIAMQECDSFKNTLVCEGVQSGVVGNPFTSVLHDNGHVKVRYCNENVKHNVIHPVILKFFDKVVNDEDSLFYNCPLFHLYFEYK